jgi:hypothetical protein
VGSLYEVEKKKGPLGVYYRLSLDMGLLCPFGERF